MIDRPEMHTLLRRQLKRQLGERPIPGEIRALLEAVDQAYKEFDDDRLMLERSLELSSRELLQANSATRAIFRALPDLFFRLDAEGRILDCKGGKADDFLLPPEDLLGKRVQDAPIEPMAAGFARAIRRMGETGLPETFEYALVHKGRTTHHEARMVPVLEDQILAIVRNVTERKEAERRLESRTEDVRRNGVALQEMALLRNRNLNQALARYSELAARRLDVARVAVWLQKDDPSILNCRHVHDRARGLPAPDSRARRDDYRHYLAALRAGRTIAARDVRADRRTAGTAGGALHPDSIDASLDVSIRLHGSIVGVIQFQHTGGARSWSLEQQNFAASVADMVSVTIETDRRRNLEEQLRQSQKMEAVGLLAGGIAHDFNNLLSVILGYCDLARTRIPEAHAASEHLDKVASAADRAAELTGKLLTVSRKHVVRREVFDLADLLDEFSVLLQRIVGEDVEVDIRRPGDPQIVRADRAQLDQVLLNLCTNARHAMPQGGRLTIESSRVRLDGDAAPAGISPGEYVHLAVSDTGTGIPEDVRSRLFEPFFSTKADGTGLGLAMVYGIVEQHGGFVTVESEVKAGSTFHVWLPFHPEIADVEAGRDPLSLPHGTETVLVAEDEPLLRDLIATTLTTLGYDVLLASNGQEAVESFRQNADEIDLVVLDVVMPRISGPEAYRRIREIRSGTRALFVTGYAPDSTHLAEMLDDPTVDVLVKPFRMEDFARRLRHSLESAVRG